jgi:hypothetical protein
MKVFLLLFFQKKKKFFFEKKNQKTFILFMCALITAASPYGHRLTGSEAAGDLALDGVRLVTVARLAPGAAVACVSAPSDRIGTVTGVNLGVNIKSIAVLLDARWQPDPAPRLAGARFDNWENCGAKLEGRPSPASTLVVAPDGSASDDVNDGNPATTFSLVPRRYSAADLAAMLRPAGQTDADSHLRITARVYRGPPGRVLIMEGTPLDGQAEGFIAGYVERAP